MSRLLPTPTPRLWRFGLVALCLTPLLAAPLSAQQCHIGHHGCPPPAPTAQPRWEAHATVLGINAALGGLTAGIRQHQQGGSFWRGFAQGTAGGSAVYAGKWISSEPFWGAGLLGRQVAAVGTSVVRNSSENRPLFESLMLPVGPVRVYLQQSDTLQVRLKLDLPGAGTLAYRVWSSDSRLDLGASVSAGTPVFLTDVAPSPGWWGNNTAGVILLRDDGAGGTASHMPADMVFAHERIHLIQYDQAMQSWSTPLERWLLPKIPGGAWIHRHVDVGLVMLPAVLLNQLIPYESRPWEKEADFFSRTEHH